MREGGRFISGSFSPFLSFQFKSWNLYMKEDMMMKWTLLSFSKANVSFHSRSPSIENTPRLKLMRHNCIYFVLQVEVGGPCHILALIFIHPNPLWTRPDAFTAPLLSAIRWSMVTYSDNRCGWKICRLHDLIWQVIDGALSGDASSFWGLLVFPQSPGPPLPCTVPLH